MLKEDLVAFFKALVKTERYCGEWKTRLEYKKIVTIVNFVVYFQFNAADSIFLLTLLSLRLWSLFSSFTMEHIHELLFDLVDQIKPQTSSNISRNSSVANIKSRHYKLNRNLSLVYFFYLQMSCPLLPNQSYWVMNNVISYVSV